MIDQSPYLNLLTNRIDLRQIPFSERGSRLLISQENNYLVIRLAERWIKKSNDLSEYRKRAPIIDNFTFTDTLGNILPLEVTTYPDHIRFSTAIGVFILSFLDAETLILTLPTEPCGVQFHARLDQAQPDRRGGVLRLNGNIRRNLAYTSNAQIIENRVTSVDCETQFISFKFAGGDGNKAMLLNITPRLGFNRWVPDVDNTLHAARQRWHDWFESAPPVLPQYREQYYYAWWIMRNGLLSTRFFTTREVMTPSKTYYVGSWQWDNFFHALAYRYVEPRLAQDQLRILLDHQREDGMIPDAVHDEGTVTELDFPIKSDVTKPPLIAWAAWKIFEVDHDREFLDEIYDPIIRWNTWWFEKNDLDHNGLCEYQHPYTSGWDDSPLWDGGMPVESPDLNTYLCLQQEALANIATEIGETADISGWQKRADNIIKQMVRLRWDKKNGVFWAVRKNRRVRVLTPINLFPLLSGKLPRSIANQLVNHLVDPQEFWPRFPVPTVALNDPKYNPLQMWRGPTWANINYLLIQGLLKSGYLELAKILRRKTLDLLSGQKDFYEYYHPETGENPPKASPIFGWSAAIFIEMAIQETRETDTGENL